MRSELWVCALARNSDPCGPWRVHRDTAGQQLRLLVRDRRLRPARGLEDLVPLLRLLTVQRSTDPNRPDARIVNGAGQQLRQSCCPKSGNM
jgi:hypothetical protein